MITIPPPRGAGRETRRRRFARENLARVLWRDDGHRRLPRERDLVAAMKACDPRDVWWVCEASSAGPVYLLPTQEWIAALARFIRKLGAKRVLEVAAGDGFLSACLRKKGIHVVATDDASWTRLHARMTAKDKRDLKGIALSGIRPIDVEKKAASSAVKEHRPDLVLVSWAPPGTLVERVIRAPCKYVLDVSVDGDVCGNGEKTWRFEKEFVEGPLETRALCRLDDGHGPRRSRVTLYYGARHPKHGIDRGAYVIRSRSTHRRPRS